MATSPCTPVANRRRRTRLVSQKSGAACARLVALAVSLLLLSTHPAVAAEEVIDRVLAVAAGEVITLSDVRAALELGRVQVGDAPDPARVALTQLVDRALVLEEVNRFAPPEPTTEQIDATFVAVLARFSSPAAFDAVLARLGIDRSFVREQLREDLRIRAYLDQRFTAQTSAEQRALVDDWIAGLRRRSVIIDRYDSPVRGPARVTGAPARD